MCLYNYWLTKNSSDSVIEDAVPQSPAPSIGLYDSAKDYLSKFFSRGEAQRGFNRDYVSRPFKEYYNSAKDSLSNFFSSEPSRRSEWVSEILHPLGLGKVKPFVREKTAPIGNDFPVKDRNVENFDHSRLHFPNMSRSVLPEQRISAYNSPKYREATGYNPGSLKGREPDVPGIMDNFSNFMNSASSRYRGFRDDAIDGGYLSAFSNLFSR